MAETIATCGSFAIPQPDSEQSFARNHRPQSRGIAFVAIGSRQSSPVRRYSTHPDAPCRQQCLSTPCTRLSYYRAALAFALIIGSMMESQSPLVRLVYASTATFAAGSDAPGLNAAVSRILTQSRRNNPARGLVGALYFGDGFFFQCLEGPADAVDALYDRLPQDPRHRDLTVLSRESIDRLSFSGWSMKFVPNAAVVRDVLARHGATTFNPYHFTPGMLSDMVGLLLTGPDAPISSEKSKTALDEAAVAKRAQILAAAALVVALVALAVSLLR